MLMKPSVQAFFDAPTGTLSYVVWEPEAGDAVVIDPILDYDAVAKTTSTHSVSELTGFIRTHGLLPHYVLETHAHADHLTGAREIQHHFPDVRIAIGARIVEVQRTFKTFFNFGDTFQADGRQFDLLLEDGQRLDAGGLTLRVLGVPGHTPACIAYLIGDAVFTGDSLFMPDYGVGRCDFPGGSAEALYESVTSRLYTLPDSTRVFVGHDYAPGGRETRYESTIGEEKRNNIQLSSTTGKLEFVDFRNARDATLPAPRLIYPSVPFNINGGEMPDVAINRLELAS